MAASETRAAPGPVVLVVEDEPGILDFVQRGLQARGFTVLTAADGITGAALALAEHVDLVVLDMMLRGQSGMQVLADLRDAKPRLPVIALTARGEVEDRIAGLNAGASDYVVKPFSLEELAARISAQLRFAGELGASTLTAGDIELDLLSRTVRAGGEPVRLSNTEFELLSHLLQHRGTVLTRGQILRAVWGYEHDPGTNVLDVYVGYLRRKLRRPDSELPITTIRSVGYRFDAGD